MDPKPENLDVNSSADESAEYIDRLREVAWSSVFGVICLEMKEKLCYLKPEGLPEFYQKQRLNTQSVILLTSFDVKNSLH